MNNKGWGRETAWFKNILDDGNSLDLVAAFFIVIFLLWGKNGRRNQMGENQNQVSLGVDSYLPLGYFCVCMVKRMKESHWASRREAGKGLDSH